MTVYSPVLTLNVHYAVPVPPLRIRQWQSAAEIMNEIRSAPLSHPQIASRIHRRAYEILGNSDPFAELKASGNRQAKEVCKKIRDELSTFRDFALASVIGNTFDYGVKGHIVEENFSDFFQREFARGLYIDDTEKIARLCDRVVYLSDNCGEIVLDRLFIEYLRSRGSHVTLAVKEAPILNDATLKDARDLGLDRHVSIFSQQREEELRSASAWKIFLTIFVMPFPGALIIIAKGMANFESLSEMDNLPPVAYLMAAKCKPVADEVGVPVGSKIALLRA